MKFIPELSYPSIKPVAWFHAYVVCSVIGIRWGKYTPTSANANPELSDILREYLTYACGDDEWTKGRILEAIRGKTGTTLKQAARQVFPSLFPRNRKARPLDVPKEVIESGVTEVSFDMKRIEEWRERVKAIKKEITMSENTTEETTADQTASETQATRTPKVNFIIPQGVDPESITLENYREVTGKRFRMTKDQANVRNLSREDAFAESKALAISQLGGN